MHAQSSEFISERYTSSAIVKILSDETEFSLKIQNRMRFSLRSSLPNSIGSIYQKRVFKSTAFKDMTFSKHQSCQLFNLYYYSHKIRFGWFATSTLGRSRVAVSAAAGDACLCWTDVWRPAAFVYNVQHLYFRRYVFLFMCTIIHNTPVLSSARTFGEVADVLS